MYLYYSGVVVNYIDANSKLSWLNHYLLLHSTESTLSGQTTTMMTMIFASMYYLPSATNQTNPNENAPVSVEINKTVSDWTWPLNYCEYSTEQSRDCGCSWRETGSENRNVKSHEIYQGQVTFHLMATMLLHRIAIYLLLHSVMQLSTVGSYARRRLYRTFLYSGRNS